jgi:hypothetical protein
VAQIPTDGTYRITTDGKVGAFIDPQLAFGHAGTMGRLPWLFVMAMIDLVIAVVWLSRRRRAGPAVELPDPMGFDVDEVGTDNPFPATVTGRPTPAYIPADRGVHLEQLKDLAALRDSASAHSGGVRAGEAPRARRPLAPHHRQQRIVGADIERALSTATSSCPCRAAASNTASRAVKSSCPEFLVHGHGRVDVDPAEGVRRQRTEVAVEVHLCATTGVDVPVGAELVGVHANRPPPTSVEHQRRSRRSDSRRGDAGLPGTANRQQCRGAEHRQTAS